MKRDNAWLSYNEQEKKKVMDLSKEYINFISDCKTERECVAEAVIQAKEAGYRDMNEYIEGKKTIQAGDKLYAVNMDKTIALFHIGTKDIEQGMNILGAHIDSPRLDLKQNPLYEEGEQALLETHYYGGIKKYQWVTLPLAIHGVVVKKDGTKINVSIGEKEGEPVFCITDLLVHLAKKQLDKKGTELVEGEDLNVLVGSMPVNTEEKQAIKENVLTLIKEQYGFEEEDFLSAELEVVPAGRARDCGIDKSMVIGYGQDDRVCAFTSLKAMLQTETKEKTSVCLLVDKEEIGSVGATGMQSRFFENTVAELIALQGEYSELKLNRALKNSHMLSSDVSAAFDPNYAAVMEKKNSAYLGKGIVLNKYTGARGKSGCNDANPEYIASLRNIFDKEKVSFQTAELGKVDQGGGGTIAYILAEYNMQVIDCGVAVLNMHAPWEVTSKADIYETYKGYQAFLNHNV